VQVAAVQCGTAVQSGQVSLVPFWRYLPESQDAHWAFVAVVQVSVVEQPGMFVQEGQVSGVPFCR
jgi:hypothetical protein